MNKQRSSFSCDDFDSGSKGTKRKCWPFWLHIIQFSMIQQLHDVWVLYGGADIVALRASSHSRLTLPTNLPTHSPLKSLSSD